jgi:predicted transposase YbfD/YdcC
MFKKITKIFKSIPDPRVEGRTKYPLWHIITIAFIAILNGNHGWKGIYMYAATNASYLRYLIKGLSDIPAVDTIARALAKLNSDHFCDIMVKLSMRFLKKYHVRKAGRPRKDEPPEVINLDGKSVNGAVTRREKKSKVHILNAVCDFVVICAKKVAEKSNEITAIPIVLDILDKAQLLKGKVVTIDAMGCQKSIVEKILKYKADFLFGLKGNQGTLLNDVEYIFNVGLEKFKNEFNVSTYTSPVTAISGRIEKRVITVVYVIYDTMREWLTKIDDWPGLKAVIKVERFVEFTDEKPSTSEVRYFITSLTIPPKQMLDVTIKHWSVETIHGYLDAVETFAEDKCKIYRGNAAEFLSLLRKLALNIILPIKRLHCKESVKTIIDLLDRCPPFLEEVLTKDPIDVKPPEQWRKIMGQGLLANFMPEIQTDTAF